MSDYPIAASLGPLEALLSDPEISEIFVDGPGRISVVRGGQLKDTAARFDHAQHLIEVVRAIVTPLGRRFDESHPLLDLRLPDGSRVSAAGPPIAIDGPALTISKAYKNTLDATDLVQRGALDTDTVAFLLGCVAGRANILVSGLQAAGKTTLLNVLGAMIPRDERIITIEEASELALPQRRVVRLETRPPNIEGRGAITQRDLVMQALRMFPERLLVGELRGGEAWPLIQAIATGHNGSMATIHASSPRDALARLELFVTASDPSIGLVSVREQAVRAIDLIVHMARGADGVRRVTQIAEVQPLERDVMVLHDLFMFAEDPHGAGLGAGRLAATGQLPALLGRLRQRGVELPPDLFAAGN